MHEFSIARNILEIIEKEMKLKNFTKLNRVQLKIGDLTAVNDDALIFCFDALVSDGPFKGARLEIEKIPVRGKCTACGWEFQVENFAFICPGCGGNTIETLSGDELEIAYLEVD